MTELTQQMRPQAVSDYLCQRYRIQPGQALCVALNQPRASDNYQALLAWVREIIQDYRDLEPAQQVSAIEYELCERMIAAGFIDGSEDGYDVPAHALANLFDAVPGRSSQKRGIGDHRNPSSRQSATVIEFPRGGDHG